RLPLRRHCACGCRMALEHPGCRARSTGVQEPPYLGFMDGVWAGERVGWAVVDGPCCRCDQMVEQVSVTEVGGSAGELHQDWAEMVVRCEFGGMAKAGDGGGGPFNLAQLVAVDPQREDEQAPIVEALGEPEPATGPAGGAGEAFLGQDVAEGD